MVGLIVILLVIIILILILLIIITIIISIILTLHIQILILIQTFIFEHIVWAGQQLAGHGVRGQDAVLGATKKGG